ncbi:hypothetical protein ACTU44_16045 [Thalassospira sp. SM2505]
MTDSDAPKPDQTKPASGTTDRSANLHEAGPAVAENGLTEPVEAQDGLDQGPLNEPQAALDIMTALCHEFGLLGTSPQSADASSPSHPANQDAGLSQPGETAFEIIQRFLFDDPGRPGSTTPRPNFNDAIPDPTSVIAGTAQTNSPPGKPSNSEAPAMNNPFFDTSSTGETSTQAQWGVTITNRDGSSTDLNGPVIADDMFRTSMPRLSGNTSDATGDPDWTISMAQGHPLSAGRTSAQTAVGARLVADDLPQSLKGWRLRVGQSADAQSELSVSVPTSAPSQLRALMFDSTAKDDAQNRVSEVPVYGGGPLALHLEQSVGSIASGTVPNLALIRLIFADRAPIPVQFEYTGTLPSPIVGGNILAGPNYTIPFRVQITPPSEGDKGASLVALVRYDQETGFNVTAQLLTEARTCTPTAILTCAGQSDNSACKAASMVSNSNGRLETCLTGLATSPDEGDLAQYGFVLTDPATITTQTDAKPDATASTAKTGTSKDSSPTADASTKGAASDPDSSTDKSGSSDTGNATAKSSGRAAKGSSSNTDNNNSTKGGT